MVDIPVITCARCNRPVEMWEVYKDACTNKYVFKVSCHGSSDSCTLRLDDPAAIISAVAFQHEVPQIRHDG